MPAQVVCDNLKSGVTKACFYDPAVNRTYADMAEHYGTAVVSARPWKPRDKAKVEVAVQIAERWIITHLRNQQFSSLSEINTAIRALLDHLNDRATRHLRASRREIFDQVECAALKPLPAKPFRSCLGIMRLAKPHGPEALEAACERALTIGARSYSSAHSILKNNLHRAKAELAADGPAIQHGNIRGPGYFH